VLANGILWLVFAANFALKSYPYTPHTKTFEEQSPPYVFWGRAFPFERYMSPLMRLTRFLEWPSFFSARPYFACFDSRVINGDQVYGGVSVTGYYLLIVCLLSFLQWYLLGWFLDHLKRFSVSRGPDLPTPGHTYDAH
jgi:hypothetical protein